MKTYILTDNKNNYLAASSFVYGGLTENTQTFMVGGPVLTQFLDKAAFITGLMMAKEYAKKLDLSVKTCNIEVEDWFF